ncbi:hypothetical protein COO91_07825 [Nostoc flagelliforme CCNUN1]|uniref:Uncharacterized protein n=1 Tax=Nostoc flagelliforme CCNUN1 TaxID=2038116 RepID=A0A2K8T221_9NOSO|nr:hypothetical protein COO91_07825 [Nostoc flagelliforme CCNUN1]
MNLSVVEQYSVEQTHYENQANNTTNKSNYDLVLSYSFLYLSVYDVF